MATDNFLSRVVAAVRGWLSVHRDFIALRLSRIVAMGFLILSVFYLAKSLSLL